MSIHKLIILSDQLSFKLLLLEQRKWAKIQSIVLHGKGARRWKNNLYVYADRKFIFRSLSLPAYYETFAI